MISQELNFVLIYNIEHMQRAFQPSSTARPKSATGCWGNN